MDLAHRSPGALFDEIPGRVPRTCPSLAHACIVRPAPGTTPRSGRRPQVHLPPVSWMNPSDGPAEDPDQLQIYGIAPQLYTSERMGLDHSLAPQQSNPVLLPLR